MKSIRKTIVNVSATPGHNIQRCRLDAISLCLQEETDVILTYNEREYLVVFDDFLTTMCKLVEVAP